MASDTPGPGTPDGAPAPNREPAGTPPGGEWPAELVPPEASPAPAVEPAPATPVPAAEPAPAEPVWGQPAPQQPEGGAAPPPSQPAGGGWGAPPQALQQQPPPPAQQPGGGWGPAPAPQPGGAWEAPPPQQPGGWAPGPGVPAGPPAGWAPEQARSGNGCLKACLIVGGILVVLFIVLGIALAAFGIQFAQDMGFNTDGTRKSCDLISDDRLAQVMGGAPTAMPLGGLVDATMGQVLDKRVLADAPDCWLVGSSGSSVTGRLALEDLANAAGAFAREKDGAKSGGYFAYETTGSDGPGDEAFCTGVSKALSVGVLARSGNRLAYVSLIDGRGAGTDLETTADGVTTSPAMCDLAAHVAQEMLR